MQDEKANQTEDSESGNIGDEAVLDSTVKIETGMQSPPEVEAKGKRRWFPKIALPVFKIRKRWLKVGGLVLGVFLLIGGVLGAYRIWSTWRSKWSFTPPPIHKIEVDRSFEEKLQPFFIPLTANSQERVVVIDFSAIWDGLASVRYKKMELTLRDQLYDHFKSLAEDGETFRSPTSFFEEDMNRVFKKVLGVEDLRIKIREIKIY